MKYCYWTSNCSKGISNIENYKCCNDCKKKDCEVRCKDCYDNCKYAATQEEIEQYVGKWTKPYIKPVVKATKPIVDACRADKGYIFVNHLPGKVAVAVQEVLVGEDIFYDRRSFFRCVPVQFRRFVIMPCLNSFPTLPFMPGTFRNSCKSYKI